MQSYIVVRNNQTTEIFIVESSLWQSVNAKWDCSILFESTKDQCEIFLQNLKNKN